jgi:ankyrin repeat protein
VLSLTHRRLTRRFSRHRLFALLAQRGRVVLHWAARCGQLLLIDQLLAKGADVNAKDDEVLFARPIFDDLW